MNKIIIISLSLLTLPFFAHAQGLMNFFRGLSDFVNGTVIPFIIGIAFLIFIINVIRYFVAGAGNEQSRDKAKLIATYSIAAFVLITIFWGIINMLVQSIGLGGEQQVESDYVCPNGMCGGSVNGFDDFCDINPSASSCTDNTNTG